eukprot:scaffold135160_cov34-Tisochrysis_lutea.AAC.3
MASEDMAAAQACRWQMPRALSRWLSYIHPPFAPTLIVSPALSLFLPPSLSRSLCCAGALGEKRWWGGSSACAPAKLSG